MNEGLETKIYGSQRATFQLPSQSVTPLLVSSKPSEAAHGQPSGTGRAQALDGGAHLGCLQPVTQVPQLLLMTIAYRPETTWEEDSLKTLQRLC